MRHTEGFVPEFLVECMFANIEFIQCLALVMLAAAFEFSKETEVVKKAIIASLVFTKNMEPIFSHALFAESDSLAEKEYLRAELDIEQ